jgi:hypothetical protein
MRFIIIFLFISIGAAAAMIFLSTESKEPKVDTELVALVEDWKSDMNSAGIRYDAGFGRIDRIIVTDDPSYGGHFSKASRTIYISRSQLEQGPYSAKAALYHELGHYVFDLEHDTYGIMYKQSYQEEYYKSNWSTFLDEYLKTCKANEWEGSI